MQGAAQGAVQGAVQTAVAKSGKGTVQGAVQGAVLWFPRWEPSVPIFRNWKFFAIVIYGSHVGKSEFQALGPGSSLPWTKRKHSGTGPLSKTKRSVPVP